MPKKKPEESYETSLPKSVSKQGEAADKLMGGSEKTPVKDPEPDLDVAPKKGQKSDPAWQPEHAGNQPGNSPGNEPGIDPQPDISAQVINAPEPDPATEGDWEHKYRVLKGKYDAEVPQLQSSVSKLTQEVEGLKAVIENQKQVIDAHSQANANLRKGSEQSAPTPPSQDLLNADEYQDYGEEIVKLVNAYNSQAELINRLVSERNEKAPKGDDQTDARIKRIEESVQRTEQDRYFEYLDANLKDWKNINTDPKFATWLNVPDSMSGIPRLKLIQRAAETLDGPRVIAIMKRFKAETYGDNKPGAPPESDPKAEFVMPDTTGREDDGEPAGKKERLATKAEFEKAKNDFVRQRITENEFNQVANRYQAAIAKGKV